MSKARSTDRQTDHDDQFRIPADIRRRSHRLTVSGERVLITPDELLDLMIEADAALNGDSNDAEHDALYSIRETLSGFFEDDDRRRQP